MKFKQFVVAVALVSLVAVAGYWAYAAYVNPESTKGVVESSRPHADAHEVSSIKPESALQARNVARNSDRQEASVAADGMASVPRQFQFLGLARVQTGRNFEDWMAHFSKADQQLLRNFDGQLFGVYQGRTVEDIAWMAAHGYPMPEDVLAAQGVSNLELRRMAEDGSLKAAFLLRARETESVAGEIRATGKRVDQVYQENPQMLADRVLTNKAFRDSDSPFKAYVEARNDMLAYADSPESQDAAVIGAIYWAQVLGDFGARRALDDFIHSAQTSERLNARRLLNHGAMALYSHFSGELQKIEQDGGGCLVGARGGKNPTARPYAWRP